MTFLKSLTLVLALAFCLSPVCAAQEKTGPGSEGATDASGARSEASTPPTPDAPVTTTINGTPGKIAKFTGTSTIGNSIITENSGRIGVSTSAPTAVLQINGVQPAGEGAAALLLLRTTGGKGGNSTTTASGGAGAGISLVAGNGGDAPSGTAGRGGSITLQPGSSGAGGTSGAAGNVLVAPTVGNVGIGTTLPAAKLDVHADNCTPSARFPVCVAVAGVSTDGYGVAGASANNYGVFGSSTGSAGVFGYSATSTGVVGSSRSGYGVQGASQTGFAGFFYGKVGVTGNVGIGTNTPARPLEIASPGGLLFSHNTGDVNFTEVADLTAWAMTASPNPSLPAFRVHAGTNIPLLFTVLNNGNVGIGLTSPLYKLHVDGGSGVAVVGYSNGTGVSGVSTGGTGVLGFSNTGYAGLFNGKAKVTGRLEVEGDLLVAGGCTGCTTMPSDRSLKANLSAVNPRAVLDRLAALPISEWSYKTDDPSVRHLGPMAQDFRAAFGLGTGDKHIDMVDASGVTMAAVQALYQQNLELARKVERLQAQLDQVRSAVRRGRAAKRRTIYRRSG